MQVKTDAFQMQVGKTVKAVKSKSPIESYGFIRLQSENGVMRISASSTHIQIETFINETIPEDFTVAVNGNMLYNIISRAPGAYTDLNIVNGKSLRVTSGGMNVTLPLCNPEMMSLKPVDNKILSLRTDSLKDFVAGCQHALDESGTEALQESFHLEIGDGLRVTALDGRRLAIRDVLNTAETDIVCLGRPLIEVCKVLTGEVYLDIPEENANYIILRGKSEICTVSTLGMKFYDINKILRMKDNIKNAFRADKQEMIAALEVVKLVSEKMTMTLMENGVVLNAVDSVGDATMFVNAKTKGDVEIASSIRYMYEALKSLPEDEIEIGIIDDRSPIFVYGEGNKTATEIVIPLGKKTAA